MADMFIAPEPKDLRSPGRYLWWLVKCQKLRVAQGATVGTLWTVGLTLPPYILSEAIDQGLQQHDYDVLIWWAFVFLVAGIGNAVLAIMRHRIMTKTRLDGAYRTVSVVVEHATNLGAELPRRATAGEVVTIGMGDVGVIAQTLTITGPGVGAVITYGVVAALLLAISPLLAVVVLAGVPLVTVVVGPLLGRLQKTGTDYRRKQGGLSGRMVDITDGLRVLNGFGGKEVYGARYAKGSDELRSEGYRVGAVASWIDALGVGLPALFLAIVTWLAARMAAEGTITVGQLIAVYGYAAVLAVPVAAFIEGGASLTRGLVAARRVIDFLRLSRAWQDVDLPVALPQTAGTLFDPESGVSVRPDQMTALVSARSAEAAAVIDRLGRFAESPASWEGVPLEQVAIQEIRDRILVADNDADLFAGTLRGAMAGRAEPDDAAVADALYVAAAQEIVDGLPNGLESHLGAHGGNLSGGQRQRIRLVRALLADPDVLLATEPTSAVDAHTEAAMAARLHAARTGKSTVVTTTSPLLLDRADVVHYLVDGHVVASGTHRELLDGVPAYRALVERGHAIVAG